jgi:3',5'-cyclic AMP phosphodiesterase CpdA
MKFAVLADYHYKKGMYIPPVASLEAILKRAFDAKAEFVIHLGDFSNDYAGSPEVVNLYMNNPYDLPVYGVYGNHELETGNKMAYVGQNLCNRPVTKPEGERIGYWYADVDNFRLIGLDTNYSLRPDGVWERNLDGSHCPARENSKWNSLGPEQLAWLRETVANGAERGKKVLVFSHAAIAGEWSSTPDASEAREILNAYPGTVLLAANGHLHTDHFAVIDNIAYWDVNVVQNGGWRPHDNYHYAEDMTYAFTDYDSEGNPKGDEQNLPINSMRQAKNTWFFREPLSAIVTVTEDGEIKIEGAKTSWVYDIEPDWTESGMVPEIADRCIKLDLP